MNLKFIYILGSGDCRLYVAESVECRQLHVPVSEFPTVTVIETILDVSLIANV